MKEPEFLERLRLDQLRAEVLWEQILIDLEDADALAAFPSETDPPPE